MKSQYGRWHKDTTSVELFGYDFHKNPDFTVVNVAIYMQDNTEFGGGLDVVPGSHKEPDSYVDFYRKEGNSEMMAVPEAKKPLYARAVGFAKRQLKSAINRGAAKGFEYPLGSSDNKPGEVPNKYAFFTICGANNDSTMKYREYLVKRSENQEAYHYLKDYVVPESLSLLGTTHGVSVL